MPTELVVIDKFKKRELSKNWNYDVSVKKVSVVLYKSKNLTEEMLYELLEARERLSIKPKERKRTATGTFVPLDKTWEGYCHDIGSSKRVVDRWLREKLSGKTAHVSHNVMHRKEKAF